MGPRAQLALVNLDSPSSRQNKEKLVGRFFFFTVFRKQWCSDRYNQLEVCGMGGTVSPPPMGPGQSPGGCWGEAPEDF